MKESTGEWNGALLSSVMRIGSVCMRVIDVHVIGVDQVSVIFGVHSSTTHRTQHWFHGVEAISYNSRSHLVFLQGKVNSARYIAQVNPVLLSFLRQEGDVLFSRTTHVHIWLLQRNVLFVVHNCPGQQEPQSSHQLNTYWT